MELIDYYDEDKWGVLEANRRLYRREVVALKLIAGIARQKNKFLDIGCGNGFFLSKLDNYIPDLKLNFYGVDYSSYQLKHASKLPFKFTEGNIENGLPYKSKEFDILYAAELIEHLYNPDFFLEESHRVLKSRGLLVISTPNLLCWYNRILFPFGVQPFFYEVSTKSPLIGTGVFAKIKKARVPVGHIRIFNKKALIDILENEGFRVVSIKGAEFEALPKPLSWLDRFMSNFPSFASNLVIVAQKKN